MAENCIFCKIISGEIPGEKVYTDDQVTAFRDIHPVAPTHILIIPNQHIPSVNDLSEVDEVLAGHMLVVANKLAAQEGLTENGYRLIVNTGPHAGQVVFHLHLHLMGGQKIRHPMG